MENNSQQRAEQPPRGLRIALGHQSRVGKDTFAEHFIRTRGGCSVSFAAGVYMIAGKIQKILGVPSVKDRGLLQLIGTSLRDHYSQDIWVTRVHNAINEILEKNPSANIVVTDMRYPNEMELLKKLGFSTIKITRQNRAIDGDFTHSSETALACAEFDFNITNDGTIDEFIANADQLIDMIARA